MLKNGKLYKIQAIIYHKSLVEILFAWLNMFAS